MTVLPTVEESSDGAIGSDPLAEPVVEESSPPTSFESPSASPRRGRRWAAAGIATLAVLVGAGGYGLGRQSSDAPAPSPSITVAPSGPVAASAEEPIAAVAAAVGPAVVQIETARGLGSGVLYDTEGHILTAGHVVADGRGTVTVRLSDGTTRPGKVLGADTTADIAVVSIDPSGLSLTPAVLATGVPVVVGQTAVAVGSPFGLDQTVTAGIISAVNRPFSTTNAAIDMLQTDAPINPGNSGGALADRQGRIIGINDAIASSSGSNAGVGFAIPIDTAKAVADQIVAGQPVTFAFLGISSRDGGSGLVGSGAVVAEVSPASPAATAGLEVGDVVTAIDGTIVTGSVDLGAAIRAHQPGDSITLTLNRNGRTLTQAVTLGSTQD